VRESDPAAVFTEPPASLLSGENGEFSSPLLTEHVPNESHEEENNEDEEKDLGDPACSPGDSREAEDPGDDCDDECDESVT